MNVAVSNSGTESTDDGDEIGSLFSQSGEETPLKDDKMFTKSKQRKTMLLSPHAIDEDAMNTMASDGRPSLIFVYCEYGNNFSYNVASRYTTYNVVTLMKEFVGSSVKGEPPKYEQGGENRCFVTYE